MDEEIIFYHTATCPQCKAVERMLQQKHISYTSCMDVQEMIEKGLKHTPVLEVNGERLVGKDIVRWINGGMNG